MLYASLFDLNLFGFFIISA